MGPFLHVKVWILGAVTAVVGAAVVTVVYTLLSEPEAPPPPAPVAAPAVEPAPPPAPPAQAAIEPVAPAFDVVRIAEDGGALVAGSAPAGAAVVLRVDEEQVAETAADPGGQFVALFSLGATEAVQILTVEAVFADGRVLRSGERVVLTPRLPPVAATPEEPEPVVATATPEVEPVAGEERIAMGEPVAEPAPPAAAAPLPPVTDDERTAATPPVEDVPAPVPPPAPATAEAPAAPEPAAPASPQATQDTVVAAAPDPEPAPVVIAEAPAAEPAPSVQASPATPDPAVPAADIPALAAAETEETPMPRAFVVRESGAVQVLDRAPRVMDNVVVDVISYSEAGEVQISGRAAQGGTGARLQIYLDNRPVALALAQNGDWASDLPDVDPGIYTLRVDQIGPEGRVVSRFETPFQREDPVLVAAARARLAPPQAAPAGGTVRLDPPAAPPAGDAGATGEPDRSPAAGVEVAEPATDTTPPPAEPPVALITVQPGHSLWRISAQHYGEGARYVVIYQANRTQIRNPDLIYPGQIFVLPD